MINWAAQGVNGPRILAREFKSRLEDGDILRHIEGQYPHSYRSMGNVWVDWVIIASQTLEENETHSLGAKK